MYYLCFCQVINSFETVYLSILNQSVLTAMSSCHRVVVDQGAFHIRGHAHILYACWEREDTEERE